LASAKGDKEFYVAEKRAIVEAEPDEEASFQREMVHENRNY